MKTLRSAALAALLLASAARAADDEGGWTYDLRAGALAGAFDGLSVRRDSGGLALVRGSITPALADGGWRLKVPVRFHHRQTFGANLSETYGSGGVELERKVVKGLRLGVEGGVAGAWRPGWPDLYQPDPTALGNLLPTDRYSYLEPRAGATAWWTPAPRNHLRLHYQYAHYGYARDPNFDQQADPQHLTPRDHGQHRLEASYRRSAESWAAALKLEASRRNDSVYLAKNAVTGSTSGYTNPKQRLAQVEPSVEVELKRLGGAMNVSLEYGYLVQDDLFQGYYSYAGHHPRLVVDWDLTEQLALRLKGELWWLEYGSSSKAAGLPPDPTSGHLESGTRLHDHKGALSAALSFALGGGVSLRAEGEYVARETNYPDYVPGVYPGNTLYDVRWDYTNWQLLAGVEYRR
jgi:hypothetical protein